MYLELHALCLIYVLVYIYYDERCLDSNETHCIFKWGSFYFKTNQWINIDKYKIKLYYFSKLLCVHVCACAHAQSCLTLCDPRDHNPPDSSIHRIFQARILAWLAISYSKSSSQPRDRTRVFCVSCIGRWILTSLPIIIVIVLKTYILECNYNFI